MQQSLHGCVDPVEEVAHLVVQQALGQGALSPSQGETRSRGSDFSWQLLGRCQEYRTLGLFWPVDRCPFLLAWPT